MPRTRAHRFIGTAVAVAAIAVVIPAPAAAAEPLGPQIEIPLTPVSQTNAVDKAQDYIDLTPFSAKGLVKQLEYDGFSEADAVYAVRSLDVDWSDQAARKAKDYLKLTSFSRSGLTEQLIYDGFTSSQAAYGVASTGL